ncbi:MULTISPECIES: hypothetical protein [unclassified Streptomyces]|uniref:hypothetical protein n=1 Tax=unclassified Streptomyces TaxID=2593676 RepID=UPI0006AE0F51|nr:MULTISPECIES: hypothetical protein [unclassified Streptomyces]
MSTTDAYGQGIQVAALTDAPNAQVLAQGLAAAVGQSNMRFTNAAARAAALTSPVAGMRAWLATEKLWTYYDGSAWIVESFSAFVYAASTQSIPHNTATTINLSNAILDDTSGLNVPGKYWATPVAGKYRLTAMVSWVGSGGGGWRTMWLNDNGSQIPGSQGGAAGSTVGTLQERTCIANLAAGRQITMSALQQSGGALNTDVPAGTAASIQIEFLHT